VFDKNKRKRRSTLKPFVKIVNYNHILPTRFQVTGEFAQGGSELKNVVTEDKLANKESRKKLKNEVKAIFTDRYNSPDEDNEKQPAVNFFFSKLRF
jgi:large subunit ribosomal protein L27e